MRIKNPEEIDVLVNCAGFGVHGEFTSTGDAFDIGNTISTVLDLYNYSNESLKQKKKSRRV